MRLTQVVVVVLLLLLELRRLSPRRWRASASLARRSRLLVARLNATRGSLDFGWFGPVVGGTESVFVGPESFLTT